MKNIQLTCAHALVKFLIAQKTLIDGKKVPLFPGVFGIFGHGNVACLGQALQENQKELPTWRGSSRTKYGVNRDSLFSSQKKKTNFCCNFFSWSRINKYDNCSCCGDE